jgi:hypothetical protein
MLLVVESKTANTQVALTISGTTERGPQGIQGVQGTQGIQGLSGIVSVETHQNNNSVTLDPTPVFYLNLDQKLVFNISLGNDNYFVIGSDSRLFNTRTPSDASVTNAKINGTLSQSKITNLESDLSTINTTLNNKAAISHTHIAIGDVTGTLGSSSANLTLANTSAARSNLGLGDSATKNVGTGSGNVASGSHTHTLSQIIDAGNSASKDTGTTSGTVATGDHTHTSISNSLSLNGNRLTGLITDANSQPTDAANKQYVDSFAAGIKPHAAVKATTTGSETYTVTGTAVSQIAGTTIDTYSPAIGERILIKNAPANGSSGSGSATETQSKLNGVYVVTDNTTNLSIQRADDMGGPPTSSTSWSQVVGAYFFVENGNSQINTSWSANILNTGSETIGVSLIGFSKFSSTNIQAGNGITKSGSTISVKPNVTTGANNANTIQVDGNGVAVNLDSTKGLYSTTSGAGIQLDTNSGLAFNGTSGLKLSATINGSGLNYSSGQLSVAANQSSTITTLGNVTIGNITTGSVNSGSNAITGGSITGSSLSLGSGNVSTTGNVSGTWAGSVIDVVRGGTGANNATDARSNLGVGNVGKQSAITFKTTQSFAIQGNVVTNTSLPMPSFFAVKAFPTNCVTTLDQVIYKIGDGATGAWVQFAIVNAGSTAFTTSTSSTGAPPAASLLGTSSQSITTNNSIGDTYNEIALNVIQINGSPKNLSVTLVFKHIYSPS